jgi:hypothetical protein
MFFANEQRDVVREENPGISFGRLFPKLGGERMLINRQDKLENCSERGGRH